MKWLYFIGSELSQMPEYVQGYGLLDLITVCTLNPYNVVLDVRVLRRICQNAILSCEFVHVYQKYGVVKDFYIKTKFLH